MKNLRLTLLGAFDAQGGAGERVDIPIRKGQALLAYLAVQAGKAVPREKLAGLLWSDRAEPQAHGSLRQTLTVLRKALEPVRPTALVVERNAVALDPTAVDVDAVTFRELLARGTPADFEAAAALYQGDFLDGFAAPDSAFEHWLEDERRQLREMMCRALTALLTYKIDSGAREQAIAIAQRLLRLDPFQEGVHRSLMQLYAAQGQRAAALQQYQRCRELLEVELGVAPDAETEALYQAICRDRSVTGAAPQSVAAVPIPPNEHGASVAGTDGTRRYWVPVNPLKRMPARAGRWLVPALAVVLLAGAATLTWLRPWEPGVAPASVERMAFPLPDKPSIAVLPFVNLGGDPDRDFFAEGLTESIITALSKIPSLFVISRNATFAYRGKTVAPGQVAEELGVRYILEGSLQSDGERVRINARLVDAISGRHLWAQMFDREIGEIFALQDEINEKVVTELEVKLAQGEMARLRHRQTDNVQSYELFLRGLENYWKFDKVDSIQAKKLLDESVALDPNFATAHAFLGWIALKEARLGYAADATAARTRAQSLAERALAIDETTVDALTLLAELHLDRQDYATAIALYEKAVALSPNHADNLAWLGWRMSAGAVGRASEGLPLIRKAMRLSPIYPNWYLGALGTAQLNLGHYEEAIAAWDERRRRIPDSWLPYAYLAYGYSTAGLMAEARASVKALLERNPKFTTEQFASLWSSQFSSQEERLKVLGNLREAGLP